LALFLHKYLAGVINLWGEIMTKRTLLVVLAGILFISVSGCSLGSGGVSGGDGADSIVDPTGNVPIEDGWFTNDGDETSDEDDTDVTAGDDTELTDDDGTEPASDEGTLRNIIVKKPLVGSVGILQVDRERPRTTAIPIESDGTGEATPADDDGDVIVGVAVGSSSSDEAGTDVNIAKGNAVVTDSEIEELELTVWTGHDDGSRLKKSIAWFQFCTDSTLENCSEKLRLNETNDDFQGGSVAKITARPHAFGDYFGEANTVREKSKYFKISLEKKGKDNWELESLKLIYVKHDGTRELAYFNPCVHKWLKKNSFVRFGPNDTAVCAIVESSDADPDLDDYSVVLDFDGFTHAVESGAHTNHKKNTHFRPGGDDFYMNFGGYDDWKAGSVRSYGDWSFDSDPFYWDATGLPGGFSVKIDRTNNCHNCVIDISVWGFQRVTAFIYKPADNFKLRTNNTTGLEEVVPATSLFVADTFGRSDINDDSNTYECSNYLNAQSDRYPLSERSWVEFEETYTFQYEDFGTEDIGGIDYFLD